MSEFGASADHRPENKQGLLANHSEGFLLIIKMEPSQHLGVILTTAGFMLAALFQMAGAEACACLLTK